MSRDAIADVEDRAYRHVVAAYAHYQAGDHADAEREYRLALSIEPHHRDALLGIAAVYQRSGRLAEAIGAYERVLKTSPGNTVAASALLSIRSSESGWDSESDLKLLLQRFPDADHLHFALGSVFIGERRWAEARQAFISANQLDPTNAAYSYNLAVSCENLGDIECARTYYRAALANAGSESTLDRGAVESHLDRLAEHVGEES